ncbi:hypothetical protein ACI65C_009126 [Semiaphis heraclei]
MVTAVEGSGGSSTVAFAVVYARRRRRAPVSPVGSTNLTRWPAGQFTPIWDRGRQVSESKLNVCASLLVKKKIVRLVIFFADQNSSPEQRDLVLQRLAVFRGKRPSPPALPPSRDTSPTVSAEAQVHTGKHHYYSA